LGEATIELVDHPAGVCVRRADGSLQDLPAIWLRERGSGAGQFDETSGQRLFDPHRLAPDLRIAHADRVGDGALKIAFSDGSAQVYDCATLLREIAGEDGLPKPFPWTGELSPLPCFDWPLDGRGRLRAALEAFVRLGFIVLRGVPPEPGMVLKVAETFGHVRATNFGRLFDVSSRPGANDLAYSALALAPHTDNPYREPVPGIQLLHCLRNETSGGLSTLTDGLAVAEALEREDPAAVRLLTETSVTFRFRDAETELTERRPILQRDDDGLLTRIHYSPRLDYSPLLPPDEFARFHEARMRLRRLLSDPRFEIRFLLGQGELVMFDNRRLLHGRTAFDPQEGPRHLQGCYIDHDGPRSLLRVASRGSERR